MTKYMIQDIVPNEKKRTHPIKKTQLPAHQKEEIHSEVSPVSHRQHSGQGGARAHVEKKYPEKQPAVNEEPEILDMLPENPRAMILDHLYEEAHPIEESRHINQSYSGPDTLNQDMKKSSRSESPDLTQADVLDLKRRVFPQFPTYRGDGPSAKSSWILWILIPCIFLVSAFFVFNHFARADISIIPKHNSISLEANQQFSASLNPDPNELGFSIMKITLDDSIEVSATGTKAVTAKASGVVVVYNEQSTPQRLIKNTRFQSNSGKIYRINDSIVVPKQTTQTGGKVLPGSIEVTVYADDAGPDYNSAPTDFSLPGLKNLPQYKKVYARSKNSITGGASGTVKSISDQNLRQASDELRVSLETKLRSKARADISSSQIGFDPSILLRLETPVLSTTTTSNENTAIVTEKGTLVIVVFDRTTLMKAIAKSLIPTYNGEEIEITNLDSLVFAMEEQNPDLLLKSDKLAFSLTGTAEIVWKVNESEIQKSLMGIPKSNFNSLMSQFTTIERANASLRPFWKSTYPENIEAISVKIVANIAE